MKELSPEAIKTILNSGPTATAEFRLTLPSDPELGAILGSFANTSGGTLVLGATQSGEPIGLSDEQVEHYQDRLYRIGESLLPGGFTVSHCEISFNRLVFIVIDRVDQAYGPVMTSRGEVYIRDHSAVINVGSAATSYRALHEKEPISAPFFDKPLTTFVAMSFHDEEEPSLVDYYQAIKRAAVKSVFKVDLRRVDLIEGDYEISQHIMDEIDLADLVIADFTLNPVNVYFELGYARAQEKAIIQTARKGTLLGFDIRNFRTLFYRNATELEAKLVPELNAVFATIKSKAPSDG